MESPSHNSPRRLQEVSNLPDNKDNKSEIWQTATYTTLFRSELALSGTYHDIAKAKETDAKLQQKLVSHKDYTLDTVRGGDKDHRLICRKNKICLTTALQKKTV